MKLTPTNLTMHKPIGKFGLTSPNCHFKPKFDTCNLEQNVADKLMKIRKIGFSMEYFKDNFLLRLIEKQQNLAFG